MGEGEARAGGPRPQVAFQGAVTTLDQQTLEQYWAARRGVGIADRSALGRLRMTGADSLDLLHRLSTQDLRQIAPGRGAVTVLTTEKGRILDLLTVLRFPDHLLLLTASERCAAVLAWLDRYTITEDSQATDVTAETGLLYFFGPRAADLAKAVAGPATAGLPASHHVPATLNGIPATLARGPALAGHGFYLVVHQAAQTGAALQALLAEDTSLGVHAIGSAAFDILRIEAGIPACGREIDERFNPLEAGLREHISFDKGCYIGQEVVARLDTYHKVQRQLVGLVLEGSSAPPQGAPLEAAGKETGFITSAAFSPALERPIALAYVRMAHARPGTPVQALTPDGPVEADVVSLPFPTR